MSSLTKQKPVSSSSLMVPRKARLNSAVLTMTFFPASFDLNEDGCTTLACSVKQS